MDSKAKQSSIPLSDIRLAKAFKFSSDDLVANRQGFLSYHQRGLNPTMMRLVSQIRSWLGINRKNKPTHSIVKSVCGRAKLEHKVVNRPGRGFVFHDYWTLSLLDSGAVFHISIDQKHTISEGVPYRVYFLEYDANRILSLEKVDNCKG